MDKKWVALITSLTVFPGCGHFIINKKVRGLIWLVSTIIVLCLLLYSFEAEIVHQIKLHQGSQISFFLALDNTWAVQKDNFIRLLSILGLIWILGVVDLILLLKNYDQTNT